MSYTKTNWVNDQAPAINATNLNKIEDGIFNNDNNISSINGTLGVDTNTWVGTTAYGEGDIVIYNDKIYQNISGTSTTTNPAEDTTNWDEITIFDTDSINDDLIDKTKFIKNTKNNSVVNSYSCDYINDNILDRYLINEVKTNKIWADGKPIYRKVLSFSTSPTINSWDYIQHQIQNMDKPMPTCSMMVMYNGSWYYCPNDLVIEMYINTTNLAYYNNSSALADKPAFAIIEYTKTTD